MSTYEFSSVMTRSSCIAAGILLGAALILSRSAAQETNNKPIDATEWLEYGIAHAKNAEWEKAIGALSSAITLSPTNSAAYDWRGCAYYVYGSYDLAIRDFNIVLRFNPTNANAFLNRGNAYAMNKDFKKAIDDLNAHLRLNPKNDLAYALRGHYHYESGEFQKALRDYKKAILLNPNSDRAYNGVGWLKATCPDQAMRNAKEAIEAAKTACELTDWEQWQCINTLAAAYAEAGDFEKAIAYQSQVLSTDQVSEDDRNDMRQRLSLYRQGMPYHVQSNPPPVKPPRMEPTPHDIKEAQSDGR